MLLNEPREPNNDEHQLVEPQNNITIEAHQANDDSLQKHESTDDITAGPGSQVMGIEQPESLVSNIEQGAEVTNIINELEHAQTNNTDDLVMIDEDLTTIDDGSRANINQNMLDAIGNTMTLESENTDPVDNTETSNDDRRAPGFHIWLRDRKQHQQHAIKHKK